MHSFTIGQIKEFEVRVHPSMLLLVAWALYRWGYDGSVSLPNAGYGLLFVTLVVLSVLAHELGHAFMAIQHGMRVRDITLLPFGGMARVEQMSSNPRVEATVSIAGPLVNVAIAVSLLPPLLLVGLAAGHISVSDFLAYSLYTPSFSGFLLFLVLANLLIAGFNLIPAFPLDGGRVLRAWLSCVTARRRATDWAVAGGMAVAVILAIGAILTSDIVLVLIAGMIGLAALAEGRAVHLEESLKNLEVGRFSVWERGGVNPKEPIAMAVREGPRDMVVTLHGDVMGIVWGSDLSRAIQSGCIAKRVGELLDSDIIVVDTHASVFEVYELMSTHEQWAVPVTENGMYRGTFTAERFVHVHRFVQSRSLTNRRVADFTGTVSHAVRALSR